MPVSINIGMQVVAKGMVATVHRAVDANTVEVIFSKSGAIAKVGLSDIEFLERSSEDSVASERVDCARLAAEATLAELEVATIRFDVIKKWRLGELSLSQAANALNVTQNYLYRISRQYQEELGAISMLLNKRGRKPGTKLLNESVELVISNATRKKYTSRAATFSAVWKEVEISCLERGLPVPARRTVTNRVRSILTDYERDRIKLGADAANQKHQPRPGKFKPECPLDWVEIDHTLVDLLLLSDDRLHIIGRPWLTVLIDVNTRVLLGYYLSLHAPSALSVACAFTHAVLRKDEFVKLLGLSIEDYPYYGVPKVLYMDNAAEFKSAKLKQGCHRFGVEPKYRPPGAKHYGGHVERLIGTLMTSKVHFLKGTTMSNVVARKNLNSEKQAVMTFTDFCPWFAREVALYHSTVHAELKISPRKKWLNYYTPIGGCPFPPQITDPHQFKLNFMPEEQRKIQPCGIEFKGQVYWDPVLTPFIGAGKVIVKFDPFSMRRVWVKIEGCFYPINMSDLTRADFTYEEYRAHRFFNAAVRPGSLDYPDATKLYREKQAIEEESRTLTKRARRQKAAVDAYYQAYPEVSTQASPAIQVVKPDYSKPPKKFMPEE
ncbi:Mu transposase C-terminal domain-containing protein [Pseudomonas fluorescens]|uniref:Mu transposase C-terminal domain-containing protein n=1 Tax=Pseudomonas fluorescens TaxID=294 RepID=UPI0019140024|nr:Mu transposase C-terminal domain-containing protein [Pseudomonas fluorescens]